MGGVGDRGLSVLVGVLWEFGVLLCRLGSSALSILMVSSLDSMMVFEEDLSL